MRLRWVSLYQNPFFEAGLRVVWMIGLLFLPVTSFPLLVEWSGAATVAPPSVLFFMLLAVLWLLPNVLMKGTLPVEVGPFLVFLLIAAISWGISFFLPIPPFRSFSILTEFTGGVLTLVISAVVYVTTAVWLASNPRRLRLTIRFISLSGVLLLLWSAVQAYYVLFQNGDYPRLVLQLQTLVSSRTGTWLFPDRLTGMAYEPSWLAHQLALVYLPLWLSATITRYSAFPLKLFGLSLENLLLGSGIGVLFLTFSRIGWLSFMLILAYAALHGNLWIIRKLQLWLSKHYHGPSRRVFSFLSTGLVVSVFLMGYLGLAAGAVRLGASLEPRLAKILATDFSNTSSFLGLTNRLFFAERAVYWSAGLDVFNEYPFLGVGIGNSGFFFSETMPAFGYGLTEIRDLFYRFTFMPNTKSMWVRLLAETGVVGFSVFISWFLLVFQSSRLVKRLGTSELKVIGWMGQFTIVAYLSEGFSLDSFAMPYLWFVLGLASAAAAITRSKVKLQSGFNHGKKDI